MSRSLKLGLMLAVSAVCVWLSMKDVRPAEVWEALRRARLIGFAGVIGTTLLGFWIRAVRWRWLMPAGRRVSFDSLFRATMIGFMANNLLPFRLGEFVRAWALARREKMSKTAVFATVIVERVVDMITLIAIFGIALLVHPLSQTTEAGRLAHLGARLLMFSCIALTGLLVVLERQPKLMHALVDRATAALPEQTRERARHALGQFLDGLGLFRDVPRLLWVFLLSFVMFGVVVLGLNVSLWSLHIDVPWYGGLVMLVITAIGIMVPAAPGYIGTLNIACTYGLALFDVPAQIAAAFSWFYWLSQWLPVTTIGLILLRAEGLSLKALGHAQDPD